MLKALNFIEVLNTNPGIQTGSGSGSFFEPKRLSFDEFMFENMFRCVYMHNRTNRIFVRGGRDIRS